jgi:HEAT repeat protein
MSDTVDRSKMIDRLLASKRTEDRLRAVEAIRVSDDTSWNSRLIDLLDVRPNYLAAVASKAVSELARLDDAPKLLECFESLLSSGTDRDPSYEIRSRLAFTFGRLEYWPAEPALQQGIRRYDSSGGGDVAGALRANCAVALAEMRTKDALRDISLLLFNHAQPPGPQVAAVKALVRLGDRSALVPLAILLANPDGVRPEVLEEAMDAVVELQDERAVEVLGPYLRDSDPGLVVRAALSLAKTHRPEIPELIKGVLGDLSREYLSKVILALGIMRTEEADRALIEIARSPREAERVAAVEALGIGRSEAGLKALEEIAKTDASPAAGNAARKILDDRMT